MDAKNRELRKDTANERQRFSIRKLSVGAASVLLGTLLFWGAGNTVKADQPTNGSETATSEVVEKTASDQATDTKAQADDNKTADSNTENGSKETTPTSANQDAAKQETNKTQSSVASEATAEKSDTTKKDDTTSTLDVKQLTKDASDTEANAKSLTESKVKENSETAKPVDMNNIKNIKVTLSRSDSTDTTSSHDDLNISFQIADDANIADGSYLDFTFGVPYTDENGQQQYEAYDDDLDTTSHDITLNKATVSQKVGQLEVVDNKYRIVFNSNVNNFAGREINVNLRYTAAYDQYDNNNSNKRIYAYRKTDDDSLAGTQFTFTPQNDVVIGSGDDAYKTTSGMSVKGEYVKDQTEINTKDTDAGVITSVNRTWYNDTQGPTVNPNWWNDVDLIPSTTDLGHDFTVTVTVPESDAVNYDWKTNETIAKQVQGDLAQYTSHTLSNAVNNESDTYVTDTTSETKEKSSVTVTQSELTEKDGNYVRTYHIVLSNKDASFVKGYPDITFVTASATDFGKPSNIKSYTEDQNDSAWPNFINTTNTALLNALRDHNWSISYQSNDLSNAKIATISKRWQAAAINKTGDAPSDIDANEQRTATMNFVTEDDKQVKATINSTTDYTYTPVVFPDAEAEFEKLKDDGYVLDYIVNEAGNKLTTSNGKALTYQSDLSDADLGLLEKNNTSFTVYMTKRYHQTGEGRYRYENISYVYGNGTQKGNEAAPAYSKRVEFHRTGITDIVTGKTTWGAWDSASQTFAAVTSPDAKDSNYTIKSQDSVAALTITPDDENVVYDYTVYYYAPEKASVSFVDDDNNSSSIHADVTTEYTNKDDNSANTAISFSGVDEIVQELEKQGYEFKDVTGDGSNGATDYSKVSYGNFDDDETKDQSFVLHFVHGIEDTKETKQITEKISYVDEATGASIHDPYESNTVTFSRDVYKDKVTGKVTYSNWSVGADSSFGSVANPTISGYTIDPDKISEKFNSQDSKLAAASAKEIGAADFSNLSQDEISALPADSSLEIVVPYTRNAEPDQPTSPTSPTQPTQNSQGSNGNNQPKPETPVTPAQPTSVKPHAENVPGKHENHAPKAEKVTPIKNVAPKAEKNIAPKGVAVKENNSRTAKGVKANSSTKANKAAALPQTGEKQDNLGILGLGLVALVTLFGLASDRKRKNN